MEPTELDDVIELGAHIVSAHRLYLRIVDRAAKRHDSKLRMAAKRHNTPTTHEKGDPLSRIA